MAKTDTVTGTYSYRFIQLSSLGFLLFPTDPYLLFLLLGVTEGAVLVHFNFGLLMVPKMFVTLCHIKVTHAYTQ